MAVMLPPSLRTPDQIALELLARRVRLLSLPQLGAIVAPDAADPERAAHNWAVRFARAGLVERFTVVARPPTPARFIMQFRVGEPAPDFQKLARELRERAETTQAVTTHVVRLGPQGAKLFGEPPPRVPRRSETSHDLQLAEMAVHLECQGSVAKWTGEDALARNKAYSGIVPDAEVHFVAGGALVVECGGSYSKSKLAGFHAAVAPQLEARGMNGYCLV